MEMIRIRIIYEMLKNKAVTLFLFWFSSMDLSKGVRFRNLPLVLKQRNAVIKIGENTTINSSNFGYHMNMHSGCKLYEDRPNAFINIGSNCRIHGTCVHAFNKIQIGNNCLIAANTQIIDGNGHQLCMENPSERLFLSDDGKEIIIEDNVWIAANCIILGGTKIGEGSIITAGSVVKGIIPKKSIYGGNPASIIKQY